MMINKHTYSNEVNKTNSGDISCVVVSMYCDYNMGEETKSSCVLVSDWMKWRDFFQNHCNINNGWNIG